MLAYDIHGRVIIHANKRIQHLKAWKFAFQKELKLRVQLNVILVQISIQPICSKDLKNNGRVTELDTAPDCLVFNVSRAIAAYQISIK